MALKSLGDEPETLSEINVTPLVDVMLVLVIILLVTAPLLTQSVQVALPKTVSTTPDVTEQPLQLGIDAQGIITLNKIPYAELSALENTLKDAVAKHPEIAVHLYADQRIVYKKVAEVMTTVQHAGISKLAFVTLEQ